MWFWFCLKLCVSKVIFRCSFYFVLISCKFWLLQNSSHEALIQSFQLAFSLRSISLNEKGIALNPILFNFVYVMVPAYCCLLSLCQNDKLNIRNVRYGWVSYEPVFRVMWFTSHSFLRREGLILRNGKIPFLTRFHSWLYYAGTTIP